jgi:pSer/pThr/pTyr-binding forkhead associated (FHA) protein
VSLDDCRIRSNLADTGAVVLEDLSPNGTYINGQRVEKGRSKPLKCGDVISLAKL